MVKRFYLYREHPFKTDSDLRVIYLAPGQMKYIATKKITKEKLLAEVATGNKCLALVKDGGVLSYLWVNERFIECYGIKKKLLGNECYLYSAETREDLRGNGYAGILRAKAYELLGKDAYYSISDMSNEPALAFKKKIGAEIIERYTYIKFLGYDWIHKHKKC